MSRHRKLYVTGELQSITKCIPLVLLLSLRRGNTFQKLKVFKKRLAMFYFFCKITISYLEIASSFTHILLKFRMNTLG